MLSESVVKSKSPGNDYGVGGRLHAKLVKRVSSIQPPLTNLLHGVIIIITFFVTCFNYFSLIVIVILNKKKP